MTNARTLLLAALAVVAMLAGLANLTACNEQNARATEDPASEKGDSTWKERVSFTESKPGSRLSLVELPAQVVTPAQSAVMGALDVEFRVVRWRVHPGQRVEAGEVLATVDSPRLSSLRTEVIAARRIVSQRESTLDKKRETVERGFQPVQSIYDAEVGLAEARARLSAARSELREHSGDRLDYKDGHWQWTAPTGGTIGELTCPTGTLQAAGTDCFEVLSPDATRLRAQVPERYLPQLPETYDAIFHPSDRLSSEPGIALELSRKMPSIDEATHTQKHYFRPASQPPNSDENVDTVESLKAGASGRIELIVPAREGLVRVPRLALTRLQGRDHIFVDRGEKRPEPVAVERYGQRGDDILVAGKNLSAGDRVVSRGAFFLKSLLAFE